MQTSNLPQIASANFLASANVLSGGLVINVGDVRASLSNSNLTVSNSNVIVFSSNVPSALVQRPGILGVIKDPEKVVVRFGNSNILRASGNRFSPSFSNGAIWFQGTSYSNISYQPTQVYSDPGIFTRDIQAPNITALSNVANAAMPRSGGSMTGSLAVATTNPPAYQLDVNGESRSVNRAWIKRSDNATQLVLACPQDNSMGFAHMGILHNGSTYSNIWRYTPETNTFSFDTASVTSGNINALSNSAAFSSNAIGPLQSQAGFSSNSVVSLSNAVSFSSNAIGPLQSQSAWSSNNLYNRNAGGTISGDVVTTGTLTTSNIIRIASGDGVKIHLTPAAGGSHIAHGAGWQVGINCGTLSTAGEFALRNLGPGNQYATRLYMNASGRISIGRNFTNAQSELDIWGGLIVRGNISCSNVTTNSLNVSEASTLSNVAITGRINGPVTHEGGTFSSSDLFATQLGVDTNLAVRGAQNSSGLFTVIGSNGNPENANQISGDTCLGLGVGTRVVVRGSIAQADPISALYVKGGMTASNFIRVGHGMTTYSMLFTFQVDVGSSGSQTRTQTNIPFFQGMQQITLPTSNYHAIVTYQQDGGFSDVFVGRIADRTTTTLTLHTARVNGTSWANSPTATILLYSTA